MKCFPDDITVGRKDLSIEYIGEINNGYFLKHAKGISPLFDYCPKHIRIMIRIIIHIQQLKKNEITPEGLHN